MSDYVERNLRDNSVSLARGNLLMLWYAALHTVLFITQVSKSLGLNFSGTNSHLVHAAIWLIFVVMYQVKAAAQPFVVHGDPRNKALSGTFHT